MKYSHNWLQKHIGGTDKPTAKDIEAMLTRHAFEVEEVVSVGDDTVLDIKVLPDRSHDALSHLGMAREIVSLYNRTEDRGLVQQAYYNQIKKDTTLSAPFVVVEDSKACPRFMAMTIKNIKVGPSSEEIKKLLDAIGQKSINNVVDATNYILYDLGKPMHVFDADKVVGTMTVRFARTGEELTTLDGKNIKLDETILVIADEQGPLSIAGIKGGSRAEVDANTTSIIIESANFNSTLLRKTSVKVGIKTDAVKRYENGITSEFCEPGLLATANLILESASTEETEISAVTDIYLKPEVRYKVGVSTAEINKVLGTTLTDERVKNLLTQRGFEFVEENVFEKLVKLSKEAEGMPYKRGASVLHDAPKAFDCSSLTAYLYKEAGLAIPRIAVDQYVFSYERIGEPQIGDLLFLNTGIQKTSGGSHYSQVLGKDVAESAVRFESVEWMPGTKVEEGIDHVGIYIGDGYVVHATSGAGKVICEKISESELFKGGYSARYVIQENENRFVVTVPFERLDIRIKENLIDEVGKLVGTVDSVPTTRYENVTPGSLDKSVYYSSLVRILLVQEGFSEVMTYSFAEEGDIGILNSVDPKKNKLRTSLVPGIESALEKGLYYGPFLGTETVKIFEIGKVFTAEGEQTKLTLGAATKNKKIKKDLDIILLNTSALLDHAIGITPGSVQSMDTEEKDEKFEDGTIGTIVIKEINFDHKIAKLLPNVNLIGFSSQNIIKYQTLSNYPFITRDVAFFVQNDIDTTELEESIRKEAGELCVKMYQFDRFQKEGESKVSYGYRLIFQSFERTLTDAEVEPHTTKVYRLLSERGFEIR